MIIAKNIPVIPGMDIEKYNGQECQLIKTFNSQMGFGTSLRVKFDDGKELSLSSYQYDTDETGFKTMPKTSYL